MFGALVVFDPSSPNARYELFEEDNDYAWFEAGGHWDYRIQVKDKRLTGGTIAVAGEPRAEDRAAIERMHPMGRIGEPSEVAAAILVSTVASGGVQIIPHQGSYDVVWYISIALGVFAALVNLPVREAPIARRPAMAQAA